MKVLVVLCLLASAVYGGVLPGLVRVPSLDSAVIKSDRIGGNFAYSHVEAPAYAAVNPVVSYVPTPVGVSYSPVPIAAPAYPIFPAAPVLSPLPAFPAAVPAAPAISPIIPAAPAQIPVEPAAPIPVEPAKPSDDSESVSVEAA